jgi:hypothetical protein
VSLRIDPDTLHALKDLAAERGEPLPETARGLLRATLGTELTSREDEGYNEGVRRGLHDLRVAMHAAITKLWRQ